MQPALVSGLHSALAPLKQPAGSTIPLPPPAPPLAAVAPLPPLFSPPVLAPPVAVDAPDAAAPPKAPKAPNPPPPLEEPAPPTPVSDEDFAMQPVAKSAPTTNKSDVVPTGCMVAFSYSAPASVALGGSRTKAQALG